MSRLVRWAYGKDPLDVLQPNSAASRSARRSLAKRTAS